MRPCNNFSKDFLKKGFSYLFLERILFHFLKGWNQYKVLDIRPIMIYFDEKKSPIEGTFCIFVARKFEIRNTEADNNGKHVQYGIRIPRYIQKCINKRQLLKCSIRCCESARVRLVKWNCNNRHYSVHMVATMLTGPRLNTGDIIISCGLFLTCSEKNMYSISL